MTSMVVLGDSTLESLTPSVNAPSRHLSFNKNQTLLKTLTQLPSLLGLFGNEKETSSTTLVVHTSKPSLMALLP